MPFIEGQYRSPLDWFIRDAEAGKVWEALTGLQKILSDKSKVPSEIFDGALNYTMCQLYRKSNIVIAESIILMLFNKYYYDEPRYTKLKDAIGTLYEVRSAFRNHLFDSCGINKEDDVVSSIDRLIRHQDSIYVPYEITKKKKNGDLE